MRHLIFTGLLFAAAPSPAGAQDTETTKVFTEDAPPVDPGSIEIELTYTRRGTRSAFGSDGGTTPTQNIEGQIGALTVTHGLREGLDLRGSLLWADLIRDDSGKLAESLGALLFNVKWRIFEAERANVSISWLPGFLWPFADDDSEGLTAPEQDFWSVDNLFAVTWVEGRFNLSGDAGFAVALGSDRAGQIWAGRAGLGLGYQVVSWFQPEAELIFQYAEIAGRGDILSLGVSVGTIFNLPKGVRLDAGFEDIFRGRNTDDSRRFQANLSVTF